MFHFAGPLIAALPTAPPVVEQGGPAARRVLLLNAAPRGPPVA
jgi:hypothetical protein